MSSAAENAYGVLVPVKPVANAKTRLAPLGDAARRALVTAFAIDTVLAASACPLVATVLVITDDYQLAGGLSALGITVVPDGVTNDLNGTLVQGAAELHRLHPELRLAVVCADLPALHPDELGRALGTAAPDTMSFVADAATVGTTAVIAPRVELFRPRFGPDSRTAHLRDGATEILVDDITTLRRDVDTPGDLVAARELGIGRRTASVLARLRL